jgi:hypothetical protein
MCCDSYLHFSGISKQISFIGRTLWKPFDYQFSDIISRMQRDEEFLNKELELAEAKILLANYEKLESEVNEAHRYRYEQRQRAEQEERIALGKLSTYTSSVSEDVEPTAADDKVRKIQQWINAPAYMRIFEKDKRDHVQGTGAWFLAHPAYNTWLNRTQGPDDISQDFSQKILGVFGIYTLTHSGTVFDSYRCTRVRENNALCSSN